ncbi:MULTISPECIES: Crp/Fnr family transcriptional regulator [unclassified Clostridioides]|uniref:Crp/Fnr family transcriptional regulator n=1 Tax=unclassified Clostridioides TaxID=2635829 RepID=UPI001D0C5CA1|nr:Crp/Fnr family transcriptional regulator [Clostridioides sp. ES-S-0001-03]MCC0705941.1 Crp/Fnr family transcriptional regulator [Clostridioides sp. ES-S-0190-01]MCC0762460.1 Crp/Fnr family transcriptional regulator [Clostridioides sp. ES-S-0006-03]UDN57875.1 Crp/Fnr family transcriptional regulator [Clostridioides sp. ES-S-0010-02]
MLSQNDIDILTQSLSFWDKLTDSQKSLLISSANISHFKKGNSIHCGDSDCIGILIIKSGTIRTYILSDEGREVTLFRLDNGDVCILSASCILNTITFDVYVDAETDCDIIQISSSVFSKLSTENIHAELFSYKLATERFSDVMWAMQQILFMSFDKRLASFLVDEITKNNNTTINMTHEQIAKYMGSAREVVSRMLKYFAREGLVSLSRGGVKVLDKDRLRSLTL